MWQDGHHKRSQLKALRTQPISLGMYEHSIHSRLRQVRQVSLTDISFLSLSIQNSKEVLIQSLQEIDTLTCFILAIFRL